MKDPPAVSETLDGWCDALAAPTPAPAGGSAAAIAGALAASVVAMVAGLTLARPRLAAAHDEASRVLARAERLRAKSLELAEHDARVLSDFLAALTLPRGTEDERAAREAARRGAMGDAARVQLELLALAAETAELAAAMAERGPATAVGDAATAAFLAAAAARSSLWAAESDLAGTPPEHRSGITGEARSALERAEAAERRVELLLTDRLG